MPVRKRRGRAGFLLEAGLFMFTRGAAGRPGMGPTGERSRLVIKRSGR